MDVTRPVGLPESAWRRIVTAPSRLLVLDHDGTLAHFQVQRDLARAPISSLQALERIAEDCRTRVVVLSGRPIDEMARLLDPLTCTMVGEHGWERREPGGSTELMPLPELARLRLEQADVAVEALGLSRLTERKRTSLVMHVRGLHETEAEAVLDACRKAWSPLASDGILRLVDTDGGVELRAAGRDKGVALQELMDEEPLTTAVVHVGDDATDEDAFAMVRGRGLGVLVAATDRPSLAEARVVGPSQVGELLAEWHRRTRVLRQEPA